MTLAMIVAMAQNRVIGRNNQLPWYLPEDLKYFKRTTLGKPIIMGRKTFDSIGKPLPGRSNLVISRNPQWQAPGVRAFTDLAAALAQAEAENHINGQEEIMVIGGEAIYRLALPQCERLYVTQVHAEVEGDAHFPAIDWHTWQESAREDHAASGNNPYDYSFIVYERKGA